MSGPIRLQPTPDAIPDELLDRDQWVCWRVETRNGDPTKVPVNAKTGQRAKASDSDDIGTARATWSDFDTAWEHHTAPDTQTAGIGFVFDEQDPYTGVDLDSCRDPETKTVDQWARDILTTLDTYTENSPTGTGTHAILKGTLPDGGNRSRDVEMYDHARFFTVTGSHLPTTPSAIQERQDELEAIHTDHICADGPPDPAGRPPRPPQDVSVSDDALIEKAKNANDNGKFGCLWRGDTNGYDSHSEARMALLCKLAFWTGGDTTRIDALYRNSGLYPHPDKPGKWDRVGDDEIQTAIGQTSEFYEPRENASPPPTDDVNTPLRERYQAEKDAYDASADREKAYIAWRLLQDEIDVLAAQPSGRLYACHNGVWQNDGKQVIREHAHALMGPDFSQNIIQELVEQVRATHPRPLSAMGTPKRTVALNNGLLDLETRDLRDLEPEDYALAQVPVDYNPTADCPHWREFITESVEPTRLNAIQEYVGYTLLTGELPFARVLLLVGGGSNGKTTFLNVITELLGPENTTGFSLGDLVHSEYYVAEMHGAIANIDADVTGGIGYGGMFKKLTGSDRKVSARRPYGEPFDYHPTTKQLYAANEVPDTKVNDDAFFRRWLIIEFPTTFTAPEIPCPDKNPALEDDLLDELPGILNWALNGLGRLLQQGHFTNEGTTDDKRERWRTWGDSVERFIEECLAHRRSGETPHQRRLQPIYGLVQPPQRDPRIPIYPHRENQDPRRRPLLKLLSFRRQTRSRLQRSHIHRRRPIHHRGGRRDRRVRTTHPGRRGPSRPLHREGPHRSERQ